MFPDIRYFLFSEHIWIPMWNKQKEKKRLLKSKLFFFLLFCVYLYLIIMFCVWKKNPGFFKSILWIVFFSSYFWFPLELDSRKKLARQMRWLFRTIFQLLKSPKNVNLIHKYLTELFNMQRHTKSEKKLLTTKVDKTSEWWTKNQWTI